MSAVSLTLPPYHPDVFKRAHVAHRGAAAPAQHQPHDPYTRAASVPSACVRQQVFCPRATNVVTIPSETIVHMPKSGLHIKRLALCAHHHQAPLPNVNPDGCPKGNRCKYVHTTLTVADLRTMPRTEVHENTAWRAVEDCTYERFPAGTHLRVASPDGSATCDEMDSAFVLKTNVDLRAPTLRHCAHFYYSRTCILGPSCGFVHAVFIDPRAGKNQRAPPAHHLPAVRAQQDRRSSDEALAAAGDGDADPSRRSPGDWSGGSDNDASSSDRSLDDCASGRFRHDPYSPRRPKHCVPCLFMAESLQQQLTTSGR
mmetsp:Transcript_35771/g.110265  ORF Transcript_35771/g.110265 Transcript_35771/m.110265 type:complete len:313 (-) Transcript_35771:265-1203(-)